MFLDDLATKLVAAGVGVLGTSLFLSSKAIIPAGAGPYLTLTETGGSGPTRIQNQSSAATERPTAQVAVRASTYAVARAKAKAAHTALDGIWNTTINGTVYLRIVARQEPTDIGQDEAGRVVVVFNLEAEKQPS
jgi:hypothetical protein